MPYFNCIDLAAEGVVLFPNHSASFARALLEVRQRGAKLSLASIPRFSAVLVNNIGEPILGWVEVWRWTDPAGRERRATRTPLASSSGIEALLMPEPVGALSPTVVLPRSKRLIAPDGVHGDNSDVVSTTPPTSLGPSCMNFDVWLPENPSEVMDVQLQLDAVFLGSGRVLGPDTTGAVESLAEGMKIFAGQADTIRQQLDSGGLPSKLIEDLKERAELLHAPPRDPDYQRDALAGSLLRWAAHLAGNGRSEDLVSMLDRFDAPCPRTFHRIDA